MYYYMLTGLVLASALLPIYRRYGMDMGWALFALTLVFWPGTAALLAYAIILQLRNQPVPRPSPVSTNSPASGKVVFGKPSSKQSDN